MPQPAVGQMVVVKLGDQELAGEVTHVSDEAVQVTVRLTDAALPANLAGGGTVSFNDGRQQAVRPDQMACQATLVLTLPTREPVGKGAEKRGYLRIDRRIPVQVRQLVGGEAQLVASGVTRDLSGGGAQLELEVPLEVGKRYAVTIFLPDDTLSVPARVLRSTRLGPSGPTSVALTFEGIGESERSRLIRYIFARLRSLQTNKASTGDLTIDRQKFQRPPSKIRYW